MYFFLFAPFGYEPEVFLPKYSQTAILHAAHFRRVVIQHELQCRPPKKMLFLFVVVFHNLGKHIRLIKRDFVL